MVFLRRTRRGPDPHQAIKSLAFAVGAVLALTGIAIERNWLVTAAIVVLGVTLVVTRILRGRDPEV